MKHKMNKKILIAAGVVLLAAIALWFGLRGTGESVKVSGVTIHAPEASDVFVINVDNGSADPEKDVSDEDIQIFNVDRSGKIVLELEEGLYKILVAKDDSHYPWEKQVAYTNTTSVEFRAFFLPIELELESPISDEAITGSFATAPTLPTEELPLLNSDESMALYTNGTWALLNWEKEVDMMPEFFCPGGGVEDCKTLPVFNFSHSIENIAFWGEYEDLIIADIGNQIVMIEIDRRPTQNIQPVYNSTSPVAFRVIDGELYISENGVVSKALLN